MAWWDGLLGGGGGSDPLDIYGDLFSEKQKAALAQRSSGEGLLKLAGAFGAAAQPSRLPTSFMGTLGQAAGALSGSGDQAAETAMKAMKIGEDVRSSRQQREWVAKVLPTLLAELEQKNNLPPGSLTSQVPGAAAAPPGAPAAPPDAPAAPPDAPVPAGAPQPPGAPPPLNAIGMPQPRNNTAFGIPQRPGAPPPGAPPAPGAPPTAAGAVPEVGTLEWTGLANDYHHARQQGFTGSIQDFFASRGPQKQTGLLPPPPGAPPGQALQGQGVLPSLAAGGGAPPPFGGGGPLMAAAGQPDLSNFTAADAGGGGDDSGSNWQRDKPLIRKYESGNRNILQQVVGPQGGYNPSVGRVTGPSSAGGYYQMIDPTWRHAAAKVGIDTKQYPRAVDAPEGLQDKAAEALYNEQGLRPWAPYNRQLAAATGYRGGGGGTRMAAAPDLSNMAGDAGGGGDDAAPGSDRAHRLSTLSAITQLLGLKDPFGSMLDTYYKSPEYLREKTTVETKARTDVEDPINRKMEEFKFKQQMRKDGFIVGEDGKITEDPEWAKIHTRRTDETEALKAKYQEQVQTRTKDHEEKITIRQEQRADEREIVPVHVYGPDGRLVVQEMPRKEKIDRLKNQTMSPGGYKPGDIVAKPVGEPPTEHQWQMTPQGELKAVPVPGSPAATKAAEVTRTQEMADRTLLRARDIMQEETSRIEETMKTSLLPVTGFWGSLLPAAPGTPQHDVAVALKGIEARTSLDSINATRAATGSTGLGQITMGEHAMLSSAVAALKQSQTKESFLINLRRVNAEYNNLISSPAFRGTMPKETTVVPPQAPKGLPPGAVDTGRRYKGKPIIRMPDGTEGTDN